MDQAEFKWQQNLLGFEKIVEMFSSPADVICDPMMGSGTTLVAAINQHRPRVIGIEQDRTTFALAQARLAQSPAPAPCPRPRPHTRPGSSWSWRRSTRQRRPRWPTSHPPGRRVIYYSTARVETTTAL